MGVLKDFAIITGKWSLFLIRFFLITIFKRYSNTVVFSCEYCVVFKNSFFYWTPPVPASNVVPGKFFWVLSSYSIWGKYVRKQNYKFFWRNPCKKDSHNIWNHSPRCNSPCCGKGAYPQSSSQSASTWRAQLSVAAKAVRPTDLLNYVKTWVNTD